TATATAVTAPDACGDTATVTASDIAQYLGVTPHIEITKDVVCVDNGVVVLPDGANLLSGDVHYQIKVTNDGTVALSAPTVTDVPALALGAPTESGVQNGILDVGETWTYIATGAWAPGLNSDTATATATATDGVHTATVSASDSASFTGVTAG